MDEGRERSQPQVDASILGPDHPRLRVYSVKSPTGEVLYASLTKVDVWMWVGSKREH